MGVALLIAAGAGFWLGGDLRPLPGPADLAVALLVTLVAGSLVASGLAARAGAGLLALLVFAGAWLGGAHEARVAFNGCVARCEEVRERLEGHRSTAGTYPDDLSELGGNLPGDRMLRGSLLHYARQGTGYVLEFSDSFVVHTATDSEGCFARK